MNTIPHHHASYILAFLTQGEFYLMRELSHTWMSIGRMNTSWPEMNVTHLIQYCQQEGTRLNYHDLARYAVDTGSRERLRCLCFHPDHPPPSHPSDQSWSFDQHPNRHAKEVYIEAPIEDDVDTVSGVERTRRAVLTRLIIQLLPQYHSIQILHLHLSAGGDQLLETSFESLSATLLAFHTNSPSISQSLGLRHLHRLRLLAVHSMPNPQILSEMHELEYLHISTRLKLAQRLSEKGAFVCNEDPRTSELLENEKKEVELFQLVRKLSVSNALKSFSFPATTETMALLYSNSSSPSNPPAGLTHLILETSPFHELSQWSFQQLVLNLPALVSLKVGQHFDATQWMSKYPGENDQEVQNREELIRTFQRFQHLSLRTRTDDHTGLWVLPPPPPNYHHGPNMDRSIIFKRHPLTYCTHLKRLTLVSDDFWAELNQQLDLIFTTLLELESLALKLGTCVLQSTSFQSLSHLTRLKTLKLDFSSSPNHTSYFLWTQPFFHLLAHLPQFESFHYHQSSTINFKESQLGQWTHELLSCVAYSSTWSDIRLTYGVSPLIDCIWHDGSMVTWSEAYQPLLTRFHFQLNHRRLHLIHDPHSHTARWVPDEYEELRAPIKVWYVNDPVEVETDAVNHTYPRVDEVD